MSKIPRTKLDRLKPKAPPLDPAWGAVLVRMRQLDLDMKTLAELTGYHYDTIRHAMMDPPDLWPPNVRDAILGALRLRAHLVIEEAEE